MKSFILKRLFYSIFVLFGVILLCFLLFHFSAGDPAPMLLGKNPSPIEIEQMRDKLSSGLPIIFGYWIKTEIYSSLDFSEEKTIPSIIISQNAEYKNGALLLKKDEEIVFKRNFASAKDLLKMNLQFKGVLIVNEEKIEKKFGGKSSVVLNVLPNELRIHAIEDSYLESIEFFKPNSNPFNSQFINSISEFVSFRSTFPYLKFFNFGKTLITREEISRVIWRCMWISLSLMIPIFLSENLLAIPLAIFAAINRGKIADKIVTVISVSGMSISYIVLIVIGQWFLAYKLGLFPIWGFENPYYLALPIILGTISGTGGSVRFYRTIFLNELRKEYIRTAFAKGINASSIYFKHLLKNASVPITARLSNTLPFLFTGSLLLESFLGIPGLGYEAVNALNNSDLQMLKALVILTAILFIIMNVLADLLNSFLDPRIKLE